MLNNVSVLEYESTISSCSPRAAGAARTEDDKEECSNHLYHEALLLWFLLPPVIWTNDITL